MFGMVIVAAINHTENAEDVVEEAGILAEKFDLPVHAVHVMTRSEVVKAEEKGRNDNDFVKIDELRDRAARVSERFLDNATLPVESKPVGLIGSPGEEIVTYAEDHEARYIVVSPERRSQTGKFLFGSVAQEVLLNATCPVVSVLDV